MMHGARVGHFLSTIDENTLTFVIILVTDTTVHVHGFIRCLVQCPQCVGGLDDMIKPDMSNIEFSTAGYSIHSPICGITPSQCDHFWQCQAKIDRK